MNYTFTRFNTKLIPEIDALLAAYKRLYPKAISSPGKAYLAPWTADGENVICALDDSGKLRGYAPVYLSPNTESTAQNTLWFDLKVDPEMNSPEVLKDILFKMVLERVSAISLALPAKEKRLMIEHHSTERTSIAWLLPKGFTHSESTIEKRRNLSETIPTPLTPAGVRIHYSTMENEAEQSAYIELRDHSPPLSPITIADWRFLLKRVILPKGTVILAYYGMQLIGSVSIFWDEKENRETGEKTGATEYIFVREQWRRKGIATCMIHKGFEYLRKNGIDFAQLGVRSTNGPALNAYERLGYVTVGEKQMFALALP